MLAPSFLTDNIPLKKSWTAPAKIVPNTIQRYTLGPQIAPDKAPNIGPSPAMLRS